MTWNFFLNNWLTYRDRRLHGLAMLRGLNVGGANALPMAALLIPVINERRKRSRS